MLGAKFKRNFLKKLPLIFLSLIFLGLLMAGIYFTLWQTLQVSFISPLGTYKSYRQGSVEDLLQKGSVQFEKVETASDSSYIVFIKDDGQVLLSGKKNIQNQISSLQLVLSRLTIEGKKFKKLDLRFDKPLIEF